MMRRSCETGDPAWMRETDFTETTGSNASIKKRNFQMDSQEMTVAEVRNSAG